MVVGLLGAGATVLSAQDFVAGTVVDTKAGRPLAGAQVVVQGTTRGGLTDANGRFRIAGLPAGEAVLQAVMLGYRTETRRARAGDANVRFELSETAVALNEIVVTGQPGGVQKRALGNSIGSIKAAQVTATAPLSNTQELLNGRVAGVVVMPGTGMVGSGSRIRIRGTGSIALANDPLIYVDGIRVNNENGTGFSVQAFSSGVISRLNDMSPNDIESIEILKGPAAATIYGTEASRGVIQIITKKGAPGGTRYSLQIKQGANWFGNPEGRIGDRWGLVKGVPTSINLVQSETAYGQPIFRTGMSQTYDLNVSGGGEGVRYYIAGDFDKNNGAERNNYMRRVSGRANIQILPNSKFDLTASTGFIHSHTALSCEAGCGGVMWGTIFGSPSKTGANCATPLPAGCGFSRGFTSFNANSYYAFSDWQNIDRFTGSLTGNWRPLKWLSSRFIVGTDHTAQQDEELLPYQTNDTIRFFWGADADGYKADQRRGLYFNTVDLSSTANLELRPGFTSATAVGVQYYQRHSQFVYAEGHHFAGPGLTTIIAASSQFVAQDDFLDNNTLGMFAQETFGLHDRLFLTGAVRVDNNSAFGKDFKWVTYPKASLSWVLNEEPFFKTRIPSFMNTFKLRAAYGESGRQPVQFSALRTYVPATGPGNSPAVTPGCATSTICGTLGNPNLGPERGKELEAGFESSLLQDRLSVDFTFYNQHTDQAILEKPIAPSTGFTGTQLINAGTILNRGVELQLKGSPINRRTFGLDLGFNIGTNTNKVLNLAGDSAIFNGRYRSQVGYGINSFFLEKIVSADYDPVTKRTKNEMCATPAGGTTPCFSSSGALIAPRVYLGRTTPSVEGSFSTTLRIFENLRLSGLVDFKHGNVKFNNNERAQCASFGVCRQNFFPAEYDPVLLASYQRGVGLQGYFVHDASFTKLREISLNYSFPLRWARSFGARLLSINVAARNLHTWTKWNGLDPEDTFLSGSPGFLEQDNLPQLRTFVTTIHVDF